MALQGVTGPESAAKPAYAASALTNRNAPQSLVSDFGVVMRLVLGAVGEVAGVSEARDDVGVGVDFVVYHTYP